MGSYDRTVTRYDLRADHVHFLQQRLQKGTNVMA